MTNEELKAVKMAWAMGEVVQYMECGRWKNWISKSYLDTFHAHEWRIKPDMVNINGHDVPAPLRSFDGVDMYYLVNISRTDMVGRISCINNVYYNLLLSRGLCHATKEAAELHAKALLSFTSKEGK